MQRPLMQRDPDASGSQVALLHSDLVAPPRYTKGSEEQFQPELQDPSIVRPGYLQETCGRVKAKRVIAFAEIIRGRPGISGDRQPLGMVKHIEGFGTELKCPTLVYFEVFKQRNIPVGPSRIGKAVAARIAERKGGRRSIGVRIIDLRAELARRQTRKTGTGRGLDHTRARITDYVRERG